MLRPLAPFLAVCCLIAAPGDSAAGRFPAEPPSLSTSTFPAHLCLVGQVSGAPDTVAGRAVVTCRSLAYDPLPGVHVVLDFSSAPGLRIATNQPDPRLAVDCAARTVTAVTDGNGEAAFTIVGAAPSPGPVSVPITADGTLLGYVKIAAFDLDGAGGVSGTDLAIWSADFFSGSNPGRSDFDGSGTVAGADLSSFAKVFFSGRDAQSGAGLCP